MASIDCPNINLPEWKELEKKYGKDKAYLAYFRHNAGVAEGAPKEIPTVEQAGAALTRKMPAAPAASEAGKEPAKPSGTPFTQALESGKAMAVHARNVLNAEDSARIGVEEFLASHPEADEDDLDLAGKTIAAHLAKQSPPSAPAPATSSKAAPGAFQVPVAAPRPAPAMATAPAPGSPTGPQSTVGRAMSSIRSLAQSIYSIPKYEGFNKLLNTWVGNRQLGIMETEREVNRIVDAVGDKLSREGMANWIDAGGDAATLRQWAATAKTPALRKGYEAALKLTPKQIKVAKEITSWFDKMFKRGVAGGVIKSKSFIEEYVTHLVDMPFVGGSGGAASFGGKVAARFKYGLKRTFPNFHELEEAGYRARTKDIAEIVGVYGTHLTNAIETRALARGLLTGKNAAGERLGKLILGKYAEKPEGETNFITDPTAAHDNGIDYKAVPHPAFKGWGYGGKSEETGNPIIMQGEIGVHPDIYSQLENAIGRSKIREWYDEPGSPLANLAKASVKALDISQNALIGTMLGGIATFHALHEIKRAAGNRVLINYLITHPIDPDDPRTQLQVRTSTMLAGDRDAVQQFSTGLGGRSLIDKIPWIGSVSSEVSDYTFHRLIPALKWHTWNAVYARNLKTFASEIRAGTVTTEDVAYLTSRQINYRFGHLNLADLDRDPTLQHILGWGLLAPDFLESNVGNYAQDAAGLAGSKEGREPMKALIFTAVVIWLIARIMNELFDGDPHYDEPFAYVHNGRRWTMRNEAEDLWRLFHETGQFLTSRLNPVLQTADQLRTGRNWRGEKVTTGDTLLEFLTKVVPISAKWIPGVRDLIGMTATGHARSVSTLQEFASSQGVQVSRVSPLNEAFKLASAFRKAHGDKEDTGTYPVSRYQQLRYALEDRDTDKAAEETQKLIADEVAGGKTAAEAKKAISHGFGSSLRRPWTRTFKEDKEFLKSLDEKDRAKIAAADRHRDQVWKQFCVINHLPVTRLFSGSESQ